MRATPEEGPGLEKALGIIDAELKRATYGAPARPEGLEAAGLRLARRRIRACARPEGTAAGPECFSPGPGGVFGASGSSGGLPGPQKPFSRVGGGG